mmetsp:Transcript_5097/g.6375  ORF Transcript_5097/g.6375 Transcript_5097/m.6375 type:complete len:291 (-) Transcript_5097:418-1290(-)
MVTKRGVLHYAHGLATGVSPDHHNNTPTINSSRTVSSNDSCEESEKKKRIIIFQQRSSKFYVLLIGFLLLSIATWHTTDFTTMMSSVPSKPSSTTKPNDSSSSSSSSVMKQSCSSFYGQARKNKQEYLNENQCNGCTSQYNQDEIIRKIFHIIGETNRHCVEFGFGYSEVTKLTMQDFQSKNKISSGMNTHALIASGWKHTLFDAELENLDINLHKRTLTDENIASVFQDVGIPKDADYVSIDIDSVDVWVLRGLLESGYRPRLISVEYNSNFPPDMLISCEREWAPWVR